MGLSARWSKMKGPCLPFLLTLNFELFGTECRKRKVINGVIASSPPEGLDGQADYHIIKNSLMAAAARSGPAGKTLGSGGAPWRIFQKKH
jgi:hypothetical protein